MMSNQNSGQFPLEIHEVDPNGLEEAQKIYQGTQNDLIRIGPKGYLVPREFEKLAADIYNMPIRQSDIFVASYQRSGTTWTQELVWLVVSHLDYATAKSTPLTQRYPFLELAMFFNPLTMPLPPKEKWENGQIPKALEMLLEPATKVLAVSPDPRFIKTHLPLSLLPPTILNKAKMVYVARDPRDVVVSCYHHTKLFLNEEYRIDFKTFWNTFSKDLFTLTPYFEHVKEAWSQRQHPNMLFLFYEELSKDLPSSIRRVADFLGKELNATEIDGLCDHLSIDNFKNNKSVNYDEFRDMGILTSQETFIRKGKTGGWREYFDSDMTQQAQKWITDNLRDTDLRYPSMENELEL